MKIKKLGALLVSAALCAGMAAPAFAFEGEAAPVEQPVLPEVVEEDVVTITDETSGALTPEGNLTLVDDYHTNYSDGSGQQFITLVSKSGATFYLVIDRNAKGQQTVHFMNLVDEADLLALMEEDAADAYTAEKEAAAQAEQDKLKAEEEAKKAAEEEATSGTEQPTENKVTKIASGFLGIVVLIALAAGGIFYAFTKQKQKKQAEKEALDPDANYPEDKGDFEIPVEDEPEETGEEDTEPMSKEGFCFPFSILAIYFTETLLFSASCSCVIFIAFRTAFICFPKAIASAFGIIITSIVLYRSCGKNGITSSFQ